MFEPYRNPLKTGKLKLLLAMIRRPVQERTPALPRKPLRRFLIAGVVFEAATRSEARALAKAHFGWERIPPGMAIEEVVVVGEKVAA